MMKKSFLVLVLFAVSLPCWAANNTAKLEQDVAEVKRVQDVTNLTVAETAQAVGAIRQQLQTFQGSIDENAHFVREQGAKNDKILKDFDTRLTAIEERMSIFQNQMNEFLTRGAAAPAAPIKPGAANAVEQSAYKAALVELNSQNYKQAQALFEEFLKKFPKSSLAPNAQFWKSEAVFVQKDYPTAILEFQKVIQKSPKSQKAASSLLKQGYSFFEMKSFADSKEFLQKVITDFPKSNEAIRAKERINRINQLSAAASVPPTSSRR